MSGTPPARLIDGAAVAAELRREVKEGVARLKADRGLVPGLAVVLVGEDPASEVYVRSKVRETGEAGMASAAVRLPATASEAEVVGEVARLSADPAVHGILVQMPLPAHIDPARVLDALAPEKDVDGLTPASAGRLFLGRPGFVPCTPLGCRILIAGIRGQSLAGLRAVVLGRSILVGRPLGALLLQSDATVTMAHSRTGDLEGLARSADILVAAVGRPGFVRGSWIKPGATVVDVGINRVPSETPGKTRLVGDVAFDEAAQVAGAITPVPKGVGPMTVACLLANTLKAAVVAGGAPVESYLPMSVRASS
ncbi:MAG: bifunctional methylenetetrahydrofolate dehydrogenase/methenyltetrahydrofolate cyclohydrolase FolD [Alphaproteobacteria bacterium]|nr:bifunctional methylenetetrahydrofolate dehydrogenase/methenyltetrahydrofolate cyclohydrolase FolD [Alphaproteobacteria bacterium]